MCPILYFTLLIRPAPGSIRIGLICRKHSTYGQLKLFCIFLAFSRPTITINLYDISKLVNQQPNDVVYDGISLSLRATAGTAIARLSHRNSVRPSVCHTGGSGKNGSS